MLTWPHLILQFFVVYALLQKARRERPIKLATLASRVEFWLSPLAQSYLLLIDVVPCSSLRMGNFGFAPLCLALLLFFAEQIIQNRKQSSLALQYAVSAERIRILQELHDGAGGHLVAALHLARREDVARQELIGLIEESLYDLRSVVDSLDMTGHDLLPLLANLRFRIEPRLKALGIELVWDIVKPLPEVECLTPQTTLNVLRIVQECINNAIQHAKAHAIRFEARAEGAALCIRISDDGCGFDLASTRSNTRGLSGMRMRAEFLQGSVCFHSDASGTTVELRVPLAQASHESKRLGECTLVLNKSTA
jgi:signal transduction histidine kinase